MEKMEQKEVKIIGLKVNEQMGILQSCELQFDPKNNLIAVKGEVGSGKTTLQRSIQLGTLGSDTLKDDKELYGQIDQEVQLLDGDLKVFVGCKSNKTGALDYVVYIKDEEGKTVKEPVIDGVKATPAKYLKSMQTALTWRMDELTSENQTVQRKLLLELYKKELEKAGVIFDQSKEGYKDSILGQIDLAENERAEAEFRRKQVGGFKNQLEPLGIDPEEKSTWPTFQDVSELENKRSRLQYDIENAEQVKAQNLANLKNRADEVVLKLKNENAKIEAKNSARLKEFEKELSEYKENLQLLREVEAKLEILTGRGMFSDETIEKLSLELNSNFQGKEPERMDPFQTLEFDENGKIKTTVDQWQGGNDVSILLQELSKLKGEYISKSNADLDVSGINEEINLIDVNIKNAKENNKKVVMLQAYIEWEKANKKVFALRDQYFDKLSSVNTGVEGLNIAVDKEAGKMDIYLTYNGAYDPQYFGNPEKEQRKLSGYSGTQKPLICLLLQSYLLSKKPKAMRYLWIDNVPIDKKTKVLLQKMGEELGLTIIVNITGDFSRDALENGELLIEGGEVFFQ